MVVGEFVLIRLLANIISQNTPGGEKPLRPVLAVECIDHHTPAGRCVNKAVEADINPDMRNSAAAIGPKKHQIAIAQFAALNFFSDIRLIAGCARQLYSVKPAIDL